MEGLAINNAETFGKVVEEMINQCDQQKNFLMLIKDRIDKCQYFFNSEEVANK